MGDRGIVLVGFRAAGKSTIGRALGRLLRLPFTDLDREIEIRAGKSVAQIFAEEGESGFRDRESDVLRELASTPEPVRGGVFATGGGVVLRAENHAYLTRLGLIVHLSAPIEVLTRRLRNDRSRPRLTGLPFEQEIARLLSERRPLYERVARATVEVGKGSALANAKRVRDVAVAHGFPVGQ
jgi:shikimate kinase